MKKFIYIKQENLLFRAENHLELLFFEEFQSIMLLSFSKEIFEEGGVIQMTSFELIWRLIVLLLSTYEDKQPDDNKDQKQSMK